MAVGHQARVGQKNKIARRWARRGTRPRAPHDQRTRSAYIFGAICPALGKAAGLVLPRCDTAAMNLHLAEIAEVVDPGAHAIVLLDQAGWHKAKDLQIPANISLLPLPPRSPELNPVENVWQYMRDNWLSNRVFTSYEYILEHCAEQDAPRSMPAIHDPACGPYAFGPAPEGAGPKFFADQPHHGRRARPSRLG